MKKMIKIGMILQTMGVLSKEVELAYKDSNNETINELNDESESGFATMVDDNSEV